MKDLLALKAEYKAATGKEWKPSAVQSTPPPAAKSGGAGNEADLNNRIVAQGNKVRDLKAQKAAKVLLLFLHLACTIIGRNFVFCHFE